MLSLALDPQRHRLIFHGAAALLAAAFTYFVTETLPYYPASWQWMIVIAAAGLWFLKPVGGLVFSLAAFTLPVAYNSVTLLAMYVLVSLLLIPMEVMSPYGFLVLAAATISVSNPQLSWLLLLAPLAAGFMGTRSGVMLGLVACMWSTVLALLGGQASVGLLTVGTQTTPLLSPRSMPVASLLDLSWTSALASTAPSGAELLSKLFTPFVGQPILISQVVLWAVASGVTGALLVRSQRLMPPRLLAVLGGTLVLGIGYLAVFELLVKGSIDIGAVVVSILVPAALVALGSPVLEKAPVALVPFGQGQTGDSGARKELPVDKWDELAGVDDIKAETLDAIRSQFDAKVRDSLRRMSIRPTRGILLFGPPGTGKTKLARVIAHEAKAAFFAVSGTEFTSKWFGESEANLRRIFEEARQNRPAVLFFDELEAFLPKRTELSRSDAPERGIVATFLGYTDGIGDLDGVLLVGATNYPNLIDPAALRPGRFDKLIYVSAPGRESRRDIFERYLKDRSVAPDVDLDKLATRTERFTGADIQSACVEAVRRSMQRGDPKVEPITMSDLETAIGGIKPSVTLKMLREYEAMTDQYGRRAEKPEVVEVIARTVLCWNDVAGLDDVKDTLREVIEMPIKHPELLKEYGVKASKGVLLFGPPGCGKTFLAKVVASESKAHFLHVKGPELLQQYIGQSEAQLRDIFTRARENAPCVLFFDEIDALAGARGTADASGTKILTQFLTEMDGVDELKGVIVVGATNRPDTLDPALLRPGRFDRILYIPPPDLPARIALIQNQLTSKPVAGDVSFEQLANITEGYSAADITAICNAAAMATAKEALRTGERQLVTMQRMLEQIEKTPRSITAAQLAIYESHREQWRQ